MSRVDDLIAEFAPDGVRFDTIGQLADVTSGATPSKSVSRYWTNGTIPWLSSGEVNKGTIYEADTLITQAGFDSCSTRMMPSCSVVMALAGQGKTRGMVARTRLECCTNQSLATIVPKAGLDSDYLFYYLKTQYAKLRDVSSGDGTRGGLNLAMIRAYRVPVPPVEVQREVVRILDKFTSLEAELEAELEARRLQYDHYRHCFVDKNRFSSCAWVSLSSVASIRTGSKPDSFEDVGPVPYINAGNEPSGYTDHANTRGGVLTIPSRGQGSAGHVGFQDADFWCGPLCYRVDSTSPTIGNKFLYYYLKNYQAELVALRKVGSIPAVNKSDLGKVLVPLADTDEQLRVVETLDRFEALTTDLNIGLPAELAARRQQYAYYRDRLLTFEEAAV